MVTRLTLDQKTLGSSPSPEAKIYGPYRRKDGRQHICFKYEDGRKTSKSYPKYLMEQKLGRPLEKNEHVDHIDDDFTNDSIDNLQILTPRENNQKAFKFYNKEAVWITKVCDFCKMDFTRRASIYKNKIQSSYFCTESCRAKYNGNQIRLGKLNNQPLWRNANAPALRAGTARCVGSSPARGTNTSAGTN